MTTETGDRRPFRVETVDWAQDGQAIAGLRRAVFEADYGVIPFENEQADQHALHVAARLDDGLIVACGRLLDGDGGNARVGQLVVHPDWRTHGVGRAVLDALVAAARQRRADAVRLDALVDVLAFYRACGFTPIGDTFTEAGLEHRALWMPLGDEGRFDDTDLARASLVRLIESTGRVLRGYFPSMDKRLVDHEDVVEALRRLVVDQPRIRVEWLVPPAAEWRRQCPRLGELNERLTTAIIFQRLRPGKTRDRPEMGHAFVISDERALLRELDPLRHIGDWSLSGSPDSRTYGQLFTDLWTHSEPDPNLRRMRI